MLRKVSLSRSYAEFVPSAACGGDAQLLANFTSHQELNSEWQNTLTWEMNNDQSVYGFCLYWNADLGSGISLSTAPSDPKTHWKQAYLPLSTSLHMKPNETLKFSFSSNTQWEIGLQLKWQAAQCSGDQVLNRIEMSTDDGYLN